MLHPIRSYLNFLLKSTNHHGVHSPFVYDLVTSCFYDQAHYPEYEVLKQHRKELLRDAASIEVTDFGAGSRVFRSNTRKVSDIARKAGITQKRQQLLFRLSRYFRPERMLELGTSLGMGTAAMALGHADGQLISVEGCPNTKERAARGLASLGNKNIHLRNETFETFFNTLDLATFKMIYVDGNHNKEATLDYFKALLRYVRNDSVIIFDDIYWSPDMTEAWEEILAHPEVSVSIDTFQWGLVFFRSEQQKEHFRIRL